jgi:hypothetical protein
MMSSIQKAAGQGKTDPLLEAALRYARAGWYVYPSPRKNGAAYVKWKTESTCDEKTIREWWTKWPDALICLDCGKSEIGVIDVDTVAGGHKADGEKALLSAELDHGFLPAALMAETTSKGRHILFSDPGAKLKTGSGKIGDGVDTRGRGGMVVLAPSVIKGKGSYRWLNPDEFKLDDLPTIPQWVLDICGEPNNFGPVPEAEFEPVYTEAEFTERLNLLDVNDFDNHDKWLSLLLACTHSSTVEDGKVAFMEWTTGSGEGAYAGEYDIISDRWDTNWRNGRNKAGRGAAKVGTFNKFLTDAGHGDKVRHTPKVSAVDDFFPDGAPEISAEEKAARLAKTEERRAKIKHAAEPETYQSLITGWVYIGQQKRFVRERDAMMWDVDAFDKYFSNVEVMDKPTSALISKWMLARRGDDAIRRFDTLTYVPGRGRNVGGKFNLYVAGDIEPAEGDTSLWDAHLAYLFPDSVERGHVLNWLAWFLQNPGKKPKHALLIHGSKQGTGKSFVADVMTALVGKHNTAPVEQDTFERGFNGYAGRSKLIVCEEIRNLGHYNSKAARSLHRMITQETIEINEKNMTPFTLDPFLPGQLLMTNSWDAIRPDDSDRRYLVVSTDSVAICKPKSVRYYCDLFDILESPTALAAISHQLMTRELGDYVGSARAPETAAKVHMRDEASGEVEKWLLDADEHITPYSLVSVEHIFTAMPLDLQRLRTARQDIRRFVANRHNGTPIKVQIRPGGRGSEPVRVWAVGPNAKTVARAGGHLDLWREEHAAKVEAAADAAVEAAKLDFLDLGDDDPEGRTLN